MEENEMIKSAVIYVESLKRNKSAAAEDSHNTKTIFQNGLETTRFCFVWPNSSSELRSIKD